MGSSDADTGAAAFPAMIKILKIGTLLRTNREGGYNYYRIIDYERDTDRYHLYRAQTESHHVIGGLAIRETLAVGSTVAMSPNVVQRQLSLF